MRRIVVILIGIVAVAQVAMAQYNRDYFFYVGRQQMMQNDFREAIRTLNVLLRFDDKAYEGYFLRGIAKYNLDDGGDRAQPSIHNCLHLSCHNSFTIG